MQEPVTFNEESLGRAPSLEIVVLLAFATFVSLWGLTGGAGLGDHEAIVAQGARQIRLGESWLIPHVNDIPFIRKPPLAFWLTAVASYAVDPAAVSPPVSPLAARLPSAIASILTVLMVYVLGRALFGHVIGIMCGAALSVSVGVLFFSHNAQVEMVLTLFCTAAFAFFWLATESGRHRRKYMALFYVSLALAMLSKAPLPLATVGLPLAVWWFVVIPLARLRDDDGRDAATSTTTLGQRIVRQIIDLRLLWLIPGIILFAAIFVPWPVYVYMKIDNALDLWRIEFLDRYSGALNAKVRPFWYYIPIALGIAVPFSLSLPEAFASPFLKAYRQHRKGLLFAFTWAVVQILFLSTSSFKRPHYLIGTAPALALLLGPTLHHLFLAAREFSKRKVNLTCVSVLITAPVAVIGGGFYIVRESPQMFLGYCVAGAILVAGASACAIAFMKQQRALSWALLHVCVALGFVWTWDAIGQSRALQWQAFAMVEKMQELGIGDNDKITWVKGRPDARLVYYLGHEIQPLFSPLEVAPNREGRQTIPQELLEQGVDRMQTRLASSEEEYFIIDVEMWDQLRLLYSPKAREVFRILGDDPKDEGDDWVLITNDWNTGEEEDYAVTSATHSAAPKTDSGLGAPGLTPLVP